MGALDRTIVDATFERIEAVLESPLFQEACTREEKLLHQVVGSLAVIKMQRSKGTGFRNHTYSDGYDITSLQTLEFARDAKSNALVEAGLDRSHGPTIFRNHINSGVHGELAGEDPKNVANDIASAFERFAQLYDSAQNKVVPTGQLWLSYIDRPRLAPMIKLALEGPEEIPMRVVNL